MKIVYLEGPDGAGKSSFVERHQKPNDLYIHNGPYASPKEAFHEFNDQLDMMWYLRGSNVTIWLDRWLMSEEIYSHVKEERNIGVFRNAFLWSKFFLLRPTILFCLPPVNICVTNWSNRIEHEELKRQSQFDDVYHFYYRKSLGYPDLESIDELGLPRRFVYDYTRSSL